MDHPIESQPFPAPAVLTQSAAEGYSAVLARAGARRDPVDLRIVAEVQSGTGKIIDSQDEVGGWPAYESATAPRDTDHDGIRDAWETAHGLNPQDPKDAIQTTPTGYTNRELYLNSLV